MSRARGAAEERLQRASGETDTSPCLPDHHLIWNQRIAGAIFGTAFCR